jgi:hypothetical protein
LIIYDILGREVMSLAGGLYEAGTYTVRADFSGIATGIYLYRLKAQSAGDGPVRDFQEVKKLLVVK